jgi:xanthine dehydrogenase accessory factor
VGIFQRLAELDAQGKTAVLATVIRTRGSVPRHEGTKMLIFPNGSFEGTIGGGEVESLIIQEAQTAMMDGKPRLLHYNFSHPERGDPGVCGGEMEVFVDPIRPRPTLIIFGMGHVGKAIAHLGAWLGFRIVAADDRAKHVAEGEIPFADERICCELVELPERVEIGNRTFIVLTTRGVPVDVTGLPALLKTDAAYVGVIGSRRRWETTARQLKENGLSDELIARVVSPMGLEIQAETPEEIALSIMAEIIMVLRGGSGQKMAHTPVILDSTEGE